MDQSDITNRLKRLKNNYRLVLMNEDTYEEVIKFKLTRLSVYISMSTLFVLLVALTASLIIFTPLKYYLPGVGYGNVKQVKEFKKLKAKTDSMEKALTQQQTYYENIEKVLNGKIVKIDTNNLKMPKLENIDD